ncbi:MAG: transcriptional regulator NrdR [Gammaproteobacteria bacterium]|nr:MAG: transcriptional regulator NrdR [Gammaproteobacteria bacterium]RTZ76184.1 MAG: transcriptional regulator NrdR [Gammaproteobacteria bacterium]RTZ81063.1 MAG: transcriptional regulator NrdR [Gammaproteobacteria bacterium]
MRCPFCNAPDTKVIDSRAAGEGDQVRRRRECQQCKGRFTTYERVELNLPKVVKSDGRLVPFDEMKVKLGMLRALEKRPVTPEQVEAAMGRIVRKLMAPGEPEVPSRYIGDLVMEELKALDQVAYVRFASVYRQFEDVQAFREEIERLEQQPDPEALRKQLDLLGKD